MNIYQMMMDEEQEKLKEMGRGGIDVPSTPSIGIGIKTPRKNMLAALFGEQSERDPETEELLRMIKLKREQI